jgi:hypothetical protein
MPITAYHAKFYAHELTRQQAGEGVERLSLSLFNAQVDLNPHQIDAALFALKSPLRQGVILADEVGLGKTIEAGLLACQYWAERKRRLLIICPASIRKQWSLELEEKFNLPTVILDSARYRRAQAEGNPFPFQTEGVVITSINFASRMMADVKAVNWDLAIIDEAHKLRNAYRPSNKMGQRLREALADKRKILMTATPLQNSLLELYGLSTLIDERLFGDVTAFRTQYMRQGSDVSDLRQRLEPYCKRTLRRQVTEYIQYTNRRAITTPFQPTQDEQALYEAVSEFLMRGDTYAIPVRQRALTTLILRKLLASSSRAIAGTLETIRKRLIALRDGILPKEDLVEHFVAGEEVEDEYIDELEDEDNEEEDPPHPIDAARLQAEIDELERYRLWARSIGVDTKSRALLKALSVGFIEMTRMGANRKALIFTESRRTQDYLKDFLEANGYAGRILLFNGENADLEARAIYNRWVAANPERSSSSRAVDLRTALVEYFRDQAEVMIATEAGAEGVNLQFCSLVINYDLPWNPQRIEQRIGRCHRYGQLHDVVVINFLNEKNDADRRVLELLTEKFQLFSGVFGASDEVLGALESGVDFEKRVLTIYQQCRTKGEIESAFRKLQAEMDAAIQARMASTRQELLEHFDEDVTARLRVQLASALEQLNRVEQMFWVLTRFMLAEQAAFDSVGLTFDLYTTPRPNLLRGHYRLVSKASGAPKNTSKEYVYRPSHPLGEYVVDQAKQLPTPPAHVVFQFSGHATRIMALETVLGQNGWLTAERLIIDSFEREEYVLFSGFTEGGMALDQELAEKLFRLEGTSGPLDDDAMSSEITSRLAQEVDRHALATLSRSLEHNSKYFQQERERLDRWAEDMLLGVEKELADIKAQIKALEREARLAPTTDEQLAVQSKIRRLEREKRRQRQRIFEVEDDIKENRDAFISALEKRLSQRSTRETLFTVRWSVV